MTLPSCAEQEQRITRKFIALLNACVAATEELPMAPIGRFSNEIGRGAMNRR